MLFCLCKLPFGTGGGPPRLSPLSRHYIRACRFAGVDLSLVKSLICIKPMRARRSLRSLTASIGVKDPAPRVVVSIMDWECEPKAVRAARWAIHHCPRACVCVFCLSHVFVRHYCPFVIYSLINRIPYTACLLALNDTPAPFCINTTKPSAVPADNLQSPPICRDHTRRERSPRTMTTSPEPRNLHSRSR